MRLMSLVVMRLVLVNSQADQFGGNATDDLGFGGNATDEFGGNATGFGEFPLIGLVNRFW